MARAAAPGRASRQIWVMSQKPYAAGTLPVRGPPMRAGWGVLSDRGV
jgi:hypothetical protein